jgi:hypothetical protein
MATPMPLTSSTAFFKRLTGGAVEGVGGTGLVPCPELKLALDLVRAQCAGMHEHAITQMKPVAWFHFERPLKPVQRSG